jgi:hypothetical protein
VTNWTIARGDGAAPGRRPAHGFTGMTLLMSTEELLAVLHDGADAIAAPAPEPEPERRLRVVPPASDERQDAPARTPSDAPPARTIWAPTPAPAARPGLRHRLECARHGHDPRPHRPLPHDAVVYRCLRCGKPMPAPKRP